MSESLLLIDSNHSLFNKEGMKLKVFKSDYRLIRFATMMVTQHASSSLKEINLLEQQISELIKNGSKHGNKYDLTKCLKVWFHFSDDRAHLIVEDEGSGFKEIEKWNHFKSKRDLAFKEKDFKKMTEYAFWSGENSTEHDGGNAMFAALEYWNQGVVFSQKRNCIAVCRTFPRVNFKPLKLLRA